MSVEDDGQQGPAKYMHLPSAKPASLGVGRPRQATTTRSHPRQPTDAGGKSHGVDEPTPSQYFFMSGENSSASGEHSRPERLSTAKPHVFPSLGRHRLVHLG